MPHECGKISVLAQRCGATAGIPVLLFPPHTPAFTGRVPVVNHGVQAKKIRAVRLGMLIHSGLHTHLYLDITSLANFKGRNVRTRRNLRWRCPLSQEDG
jgi:hypothetical protein